MYMIEVFPGSVADRAGVKANDRLVEINGENVEDHTHDQVVDKIKTGGNSVMFLLVDDETDKFYQKKRAKIGSWLATTKYLPHAPRIIEMTKGSDGYGFLLKEEPNKSGKATIIYVYLIRWREAWITCSLTPCRTLHQGNRQRQPSRQSRSAGHGHTGGCGRQGRGGLQS